MFSTTHLFILALCAVLIAVVVTVAVKRRLSVRSMLTFMVGVTVFAELMKVYGRIEVSGGMALLAPEFLPLHLCSIQIFIIWYLRFFNRSAAREATILAFMYPTMLVGGLAALVIATVTPIAFSNIEIYEYFIYHAMVVAFGLYVALARKVELTWKRFFTTCLFLVLLFFLSIYTNSLLSQGETPANFFYSAAPPLPGLPYLNFSFFGTTPADPKLGWLWYIAKLAFLGIVVIFVCYAPFLFGRRRAPR